MSRVGLSSRIAFFSGIAAMLGIAAACAKSEKDGFESDPAGGDGGTFSQESSTKPDLTGLGEVFGHSETSLFRVDTKTQTVTEVGTFSGCAYIADIALDETSTIYGSNGAELYFIETNTARCTKIAAGSFPNSLSFVPAGTLDATSETLVGFQGGDYVKIDRTSGKVTKVGEIGGGYQSSGDVVSVKGGKTFVTVKGKDCADCLAEIDPKTGALVKNWGSVGAADVFGLAFWGGELYAFTFGGELLLVTLDTGTAVSKKIPIANAPEGLKFAGAGSTTSAPLGPVR